MRTRLLVAVALMLSAALARAQQWPASANNAPPVVAVGDAPLAQPVVVGDAEGGVFSSGGGGGGSGHEKVFWVSGSYLYGWVPKFKLPTPLITSTNNTADVSPGALRQPGTFALFGDQVEIDAMRGYAGAVGLACDSYGYTSIDFGGFWFQQETSNFSVASSPTGNPVIARPVYNVLGNNEAAFIDARPNFARGSARVDADSQIWGFEANARCHVGSDRLRGELLGGFRYLRLKEGLTTNDTLFPIRDDNFTFLGGFNFVNAPNFITDTDSFQTQNSFYGGQVGGVLVWEDSWYFLRLGAKVAFGLTEEQVSISGRSTLRSPTGVLGVAEGGILATTTNIGSYRRNVFGMVPEWSINAGFYVTSWMRISGGYSLLMWNRVVRPGDAIDRNVNPSYVPTATDYGLTPLPAKPQFTYNDATFWLQAVNGSVEFTF